MTRSVKWDCDKCSAAFARILYMIAGEGQIRQVGLRLCQSGWKMAHLPPTRRRRPDPTGWIAISLSRSRQPDEHIAIGGDQISRWDCDMAMPRRSVPSVAGNVGGDQISQVGLRPDDEVGEEDVDAVSEETRSGR